MSTFAIILLVIIFGIIQGLFHKKSNRKWLKYIPVMTILLGLLVAGAIYLCSDFMYKVKIISDSVRAENQYFVLWVSVLLVPCLLGSILGIILPKIFKNEKILYFVPLVIFSIIYFIMMVMGMGLISMREVLWLACFGISGSLLGKGRFWGGVVGMVPAISFLVMSTQYTGQVIDIERPLGILLSIYYLICSHMVYRTSRSSHG